MAEIHWISIKDRLPEKSGSYLVVGKSGGAYVTHFYEKSEYNKEGHFSSRYVTHWAERPEPTKPDRRTYYDCIQNKDIDEMANFLINWALRMLDGTLPMNVRAWLESEVVPNEG